MSTTDLRDAAAGELSAARRAADRLFVVLLGLAAATSAAIAPIYDTWQSALTIGGGSLLLAVLLARTAPGALATRLVLGALTMVDAALLIHQSHGLIELHFAIFVFIAVSVAWRDWRVPVTCGGVTALHHVAFYFWQRAGGPVWLMREHHGFWIVGVHAAFVVVEVVGIVVIARHLHAMTRVNMALADATARLAAGDLDVHLSADGRRVARHGDDATTPDTPPPVAAFRQLVATLHAVEREVQQLTAVARGEAAGRQAATDALPGRFGALVQDLGTATREMTTLHAGAEREASRARAFASELDAVVQRVAARDLTARLGDAHEAPYASIARALNLSFEHVESDLVRIAATARDVAGAASRIAEGATHLAHGTSAQATAVGEMSVGLADVTALAESAAERVSEVRTLATNAAAGAADGTQGMQRLGQAMHRVREASESTAKIVRTIDEIAFQTNLLALNAAVEAARAGDAGRGFAVVAEEVRALAQRSAAAARQTAQLIEESVASVREGVETTDTVRAAIDAVASRIARVGTLVEELADGSRREADSVRLASAGSSRVAELTRSHAASAEASAATAQELTAQATRLDRLLGAFTLTDRAARARGG